MLSRARKTSISKSLRKKIMIKPVVPDEHDYSKIPDNEPLYVSTVNDIFYDVHKEDDAFTLNNIMNDTGVINEGYKGSKNEHVMRAEVSIIKKVKNTGSSLFDISISTEQRKKFSKLIQQAHKSYYDDVYFKNYDIILKKKANILLPLNPVVGKYIDSLVKLNKKNQTTNKNGRHDLPYWGPNFVTHTLEFYEGDDKLYVHVEMSNIKEDSQMQNGGGSEDEQTNTNKDEDEQTNTNKDEQTNTNKGEDEQTKPEPSYEVYAGYYDNKRNTDNAWIETLVSYTISQTNVKDSFVVAERKEVNTEWQIMQDKDITNLDKEYLSFVKLAIININNIKYKLDTSYVNKQKVSWNKEGFTFEFMGKKMHVYCDTANKPTNDDIFNFVGKTEVSNMLIKLKTLNNINLKMFYDNEKKIACMLPIFPNASRDDINKLQKPDDIKYDEIGPIYVYTIALLFINKNKKMSVMIDDKGEILKQQVNNNDKDVNVCTDVLTKYYGSLIGSTIASYDKCNDINSFVGKETIKIEKNNWYKWYECVIYQFTDNNINMTVNQNDKKMIVIAEVDESNRILNLDKNIDLNTYNGKIADKVVKHINNAGRKILDKTKYFRELGQYKIGVVEKK